jgi:CheY-like chemotaxis protein
MRQQVARQERLATVGQLAAGIAHDFNNILAVISLYADLIARPPELPQRKQKQVATIREQVDHAAHLVQQILDFSGRAILRVETIDLLALVENQTHLLERIVPESVEMHFTADPAAYTIQADPTRIQQLIMNIALNARDAMPQGGVLTLDLARLDVTEEQLDDESLPPILRAKAAPWIRLTLRDTGTGISQRNMVHVFEPFFTTKGPDKGTGLGLAQAHGIVTQHHGHIDLQSQEGRGTTVTIFLPALAEAPDLPLHPPISIPARRGGGKHVLVVEDNPILAEAMIEMLQSWTFSVATSADGADALAQIKQADPPIDLVISDVVMPHMGGIDLLRNLRRRGHWMPVLLMSGHPMQSDQLTDLHNSGQIAWLRKPFEIEELARTVAALLESVDE